MTIWIIAYRSKTVPENWPKSLLPPTCATSGAIFHSSIQKKYYPVSLHSEQKYQSQKWKPAIYQLTLLFV